MSKNKDDEIHSNQCRVIQNPVLLMNQTRFFRLDKTESAIFVSSSVFLVQ